MTIDPLSPTRHFIAPDGLLQSPAFNHAFIKDGRPVYIAGQLSIGPDGDAIGVGDIDAQCAQVWMQIRKVVDAAGGQMSDLVKITTYITDLAHVEAVLASRVAQFAPGEVPASALLVVKSLAREEFLVEIEAVAMIS